MSKIAILRSGLAVILLAGLILVSYPVCVFAGEGAKAEGEGGEAAGEGGEAKGEGAEGAEGAKEEKFELPVAPDYFPLPVLNIPVLKKNRLSGNLMIAMVLDVATDETMKAIDESRTQLTAAYTETLSTWAINFQNPRAPANVIAIKNQLQTVTDTVLGRSDAIVLLQGVMLNR